MNRKNGNVPALTGLRGVAAYTVLFAHAIDFAFNGQFHGWVVGLAYFGMSLFFVLSGFVIAYNYTDTRGLSGCYRFFVARFARLYPLYILLLGLSWALFPDPAPYDSLFADHFAGIAGLTLTQTWFNVSGVSGTAFGQSWSISTESFFYAAFPLLALIPVRRPQASLAAFLALTLGAFGVLFLFRETITALITPFVRDGLPLSAPPWFWLTYFAPYLRIFEFMAGLLVCRAYLGGCTLPRRALPVCLVGLGLLIVAARWADNWAVDMLRTFAFAPFLAPAILAVCSAPSMLSRFLESKPLLFLGEISYSVYALQFIVFTGLVRDVPKGGLSFVAALATVTVLAVGTYWLYERPARRALRALLIGTLLQPPHAINRQM